MYFYVLFYQNLLLVTFFPGLVQLWWRVHDVKEKNNNLITASILYQLEIVTINTTLLSAVKASAQHMVTWGWQMEAILMKVVCWCASMAIGAQCVVTTGMQQMLW